MTTFRTTVSPRGGRRKEAVSWCCCCRRCRWSRRNKGINEDSAAVPPWMVLAPNYFWLRFSSLIPTAEILLAITKKQTNKKERSERVWIKKQHQYSQAGTRQLNKQHNDDGVHQCLLAAVALDTAWDGKNERFAASTVFADANITSCCRLVPARPFQWNVFTVFSTRNANKLWQNEKYSAKKEGYFPCSLPACWLDSLFQEEETNCKSRRTTNGRRLTRWTRTFTPDGRRHHSINSWATGAQLWPKEGRKQGRRKGKERKGGRLLFPFTKRYYSGNVDRLIFSLSPPVCVLAACVSASVNIQNKTIRHRQKERGGGEKE